MFSVQLDRSSRGSSPDIAIWFGFARARNLSWHRWRPWLTVLAVVAVLTVGLKVIGPVQAPPGVKLGDLRSVEELKTKFNSDAGSTRLVLILSPT